MRELASYRRIFDRVDVRFKAAVIGSLAFSYYALLSSKNFTWIFASGDSGDWLAASNWWIVPQPLGSPLYISLGHFLALFPGDMVVKMTLVLSALPAAITVALVYLIVRRMTGKEWAALVSSAVLLGCGVFLSQATVLEEYSLAVMFVVLGFYFYEQRRWKLTLMALGFGSAVHVMVFPIALFWLMVHAKEWRVWGRALPVYLACGVLPYGLILWLMASDAPRLLAGGLSLGAINSYLGSSGVVGSLSIIEAPERLLYLGMFLVVALGLGIVPGIIGLKKPWDKTKLVIILTILFSVWYYATCIDPTTWTFMVYAMPMLVIACGLGLAQMKRQHAYAVLAGALCLVAINGVYLNADRLTKNDPVAVQYYESIQQIPDGSAVVINRGGWEALGLFYAMSEGKDVIPVFYIYAENEGDPLHRFYVEWMGDKYGIQGSDTQTMAQYALDKGMPVYILLPLTVGWERAFRYDNSLYRFGEVIAVDTTAVVNEPIGEEQKWHPFLGH